VRNLTTQNQRLNLSIQDFQPNVPERKLAKTVIFPQGLLQSGAIPIYTPAGAFTNQRNREKNITTLGII
jgi:hypothetical protein